MLHAILTNGVTLAIGAAILDISDLLLPAWLLVVASSVALGALIAAYRATRHDTILPMILVFAWFTFVFLLTAFNVLDSEDRAAMLRAGFFVLCIAVVIDVIAHLNRLKLLRKKK